MKEVSPEEYRTAFGIDVTDSEVRKRALEHALDIRKFEIELYWKRATYFWAFIAAALAAYGAVQSLKDPSDRQHLSVIASALGFVFSFSWCCVNRGSKYWQENWEKHVDMLEDELIGPLYKTFAKGAVFSVTKINEIVSVFVTILWVPMTFLALNPIRFCARPDWFVVVLIALALGACLVVFLCGRTNLRDQEFIMSRRTSKISKSSLSE